MPLATGGTTTTANIGGTNYYIHTFTTSGTITFTSGGSVDYLIIGGGGAGGYSISNGTGGGGGAGGFISGTTTVTAQTYTVTVGGGGTGARPTATMGGNSSVFGSTAIGGGYGGYGIAATPGGGNGGSGGGGGDDYPASAAAGKGVYPGSTYISATRQGYDGGTGGYGTGGGQNAGGGGGAGGAGTAGGTGSGNGGIGANSSITGTAVTYAGGGASGGSSTPGAGGGGAGGVSGNNGYPGTANTGGGGGGGGANYPTNSLIGGNGGSGIVIIRYTIDITGTVLLLSGSGGTYTTQTVLNKGYRQVYGIHIFTTSGNLTLNQGGSVEYMVIGGGGGGGSDMGGGGGAGGYLAGTTTLSAGTYSITVGSGGTGAPAGISQVRGTNGGSSALTPQNFKGHSVSFDGTGDGVNCGTQSVFALGTAAFTLEGWIYTLRLKNYSTLWTTRPDNGNYADAYHVGWDSAGGISLYNGSTAYAGAPSGTIKQGQWHHVAIVKNSSNNLATFVDGVRVGYAASFTSNLTRTLLGLGDFPTTKAECIEGYISNARIVAGTAVYDPTLTTCTVPTAPLTAIAGTVILTAQNFAFTDNSANNFTLTAQGNSVLSHFTPFTSLAITAAGGGGGASEYGNNNSPAGSGGSGGGVASSSSTTNGLAVTGQGNAGGTSGGSYYPGGGGGAGGAGSTGPANGGTGVANAILGTTYYWAGGGGGAGYSGIAGNGGLGGGGGGAPKTTSGGGLPGGQTYTQAITPYALAGTFGSVGSLGAQTNVPGGNAIANTGGGGGGGAHYNSNNFGGNGAAGIVVVKYLASLDFSGSGGTGNVYAGGGGGAGNDAYVGVTRPTIVRAFTSSGNLTVTGSGNVEYMIVGGGGGAGSDMGGGGGAGGYLAGYTTLTTGTYLVTVGAGGSGAPAGISQVRGSNGTDSAIQPYSNSQANYSYYFDTYNDYLSLASNSAFDIGSNDACVELWFWMYKIDGTYHTFNGQNSTTGSTIRIGYNSGSLYYTINNDTARGANTSVDIQTWYHCVVTYTGGTAKFFVNGQLRDVATGLGTIPARAETYYIGQEDSIWMDGYISNFRFCNGSIPTGYQTASTTLYAQIFTPPTAPLTTTSQGATAAHVKILTCQSATIVDNSPNNFTITKTGDVAPVRFSPFDSLIAAGGGGGASEYGNNTSPAASGGSGGGVAGSSSTTNGQGIRPNTQGLAGQGYAGGTSGGSYYPGGGGGAGGAGSTAPANGGNGVLNSILGTSYYWAAGGGGAGYSGIAGNGGLGGGGGGAPKVSGGGLGGTGGYNSGSDGTVGSLSAQTNVPGGNAGTNTGSGGGGGAHYSSNNYGGSGGSGIVVIKYRPDLVTITGGQIVLSGASVTDTNYVGGLGGNGYALSSGTLGSLGGGGGGGSSATVGGGGGGIDVFGAATSGIAGTAGNAGGGGSSITVLGIAPSNGGVSGNAITGNGGPYGGGGGGLVTSTPDPTKGNGASGAVMFVWTNTANTVVPSYPALAQTSTNSIGSLVSSNTTNSITSGKMASVSAGSEIPLFIQESISSRTANTILGTNYSDGLLGVTAYGNIQYSPFTNLYRTTPITQDSDIPATTINVLKGSLGINVAISTQTSVTVTNQLPAKVGTAISRVFNSNTTQTTIPIVTLATNNKFITGNITSNTAILGQAFVTVNKQDEWMLVVSDPTFPVDYNTTYNYTAIKPVTISNDPRNKYLRANYIQKDVTGQSPKDPQEYL